MNDELPGLDLLEAPATLHGLISKISDEDA
jgi:hypothetical protein